MGEAKRRRSAEATVPMKSRERVTLAAATRLLVEHLIVPDELRGACYCSSLALRHHLASMIAGVRS